MKSVWSKVHDCLELGHCSICNRAEGVICLLEWMQVFLSLMYLSCSGWFLLWASQWPSWTCRWSGCPWALSGHGCCCLKMPSRAPYTLYSSVSGSSSVVNTSWLAGLSLLLHISLHFPASCYLFFHSLNHQDQRQRNLLSVYWWQVGLVVFGSCVLLIFDLSER